MNLENSKGQRFFGLHFYPGVAQYDDGTKMERVLLNEDTLRKMDQTFEGRPVYVMHVDDVNKNLDELRKEVDGWVLKSFYNAADGKHWVEFLVVSERGLRAVKNGMRLSNAYLPKKFASGGLWNGVEYHKEIVDGEYEHLALVTNPRYDESVIMTPEKFKKYNEDKNVEIKRFLNSKGDEGMFFKRKIEKVENDLADVMVKLPKSGKEILVSKLVNDADVAEATKDEPRLVNSIDLVQVGEAKMSIADLVSEYEALLNAKKCNEEKEEEDKEKKENEEKDDEKEVEDKKKENEEEEKEKMKNKKKKNEADDKADREAAARLKNAPAKFMNAAVKIDLPEDQVARGISRYGSGK